MAESGRPASRNAVTVRLVFDAKKLPLFRDRWQGTTPGAESGDKGDMAVAVTRWLAPIPLYAVSKLEVPSQEERSRIRALLSQLSNVSLPDAEIEVGDARVLAAPAQAESAGEASFVELPESLDAIQGAMAMAAWGVPCVDPWIEALQSALNRDANGVACRLATLGAQWLEIPWCDDQRPSADDNQAALWRAAVTAMRSPCARGRSPMQLAESIAQQACNDRNDGTTEEWLCRTQRILAAEETVSQGEIPAGLAIQLVLLRPEPREFRAWNRALPWLAPGIWWAAAILCGWRHGYRGLDKRFRGEAALREFLTARGLAASWAPDDTVPLPAAQQASLELIRENGRFSLYWGERQVLCKQWKSRAKWYRADLGDEAVAKAAREFAGNLGWECSKSIMRLKEVCIPVRGPGKLEVNERRHLVVRGELEIELPAGTSVELKLDESEFRRELAAKGGVVPEPPEHSIEQEGGIPGFVYELDFITEAEERDLVERIDGSKWSEKLKRRVQHYGWRYDYGKRKIDASMYLGKLPDWAVVPAQRLVDNGLMDELPDQLIVNEYRGNQGISRHIDQPDSFAEAVATISLLETWGMVFRLGKKKVEKRLERRSVAVLTGDARYKWTHEIPPRKTEPAGERPGRVQRERRISLTFRKARAMDGGLLGRASKSAAATSAPTGFRGSTPA